jgi:hypothetical protein
MSFVYFIPSAPRERVVTVSRAFAGSVVAIFRHFDYALRHDPSLLPLLSPHFPRQSLFIATYQMSKIVNAVLKPATPADIPLELDCGRWYFALQEACRIPDECGRRGCEHKITARCTNCKTGYCGVDCQKQYVVLFNSGAQRVTFLWIGTGRSINLSVS